MQLFSTYVVIPMRAAYPRISTFMAVTALSGTNAEAPRPS